MSEKKYVVPEKMLRAATASVMKIHGYGETSSRYDYESHEANCRIALEAALRWLGENPIVPTQEQLESLTSDWRLMGTPCCSTQFIAVEWQRRMFLAPEPEIPEEVKDLLYGECASFTAAERVDARIIEAYRRGKRSKP